MNPEIPKTSSPHETKNETGGKSKIGRGKRNFREFEVINENVDNGSSYAGKNEEMSGQISKKSKRQKGKVKSKSLDSLYSTEEERLILSESENEGSESDSVVEIRKSVLIREVPKIGKYDV